MARPAAEPGDAGDGLTDLSLPDAASPPRGGRSAAAEEWGWERQRPSRNAKSKMQGDL
jgi:hypothetical protein